MRGFQEAFQQALPTWASHIASCSLLPESAAPCRRMRSALLALAVLALLAAAPQAAGEGTAVKLCGRDFVRAIVFTCGGSRWKRDLADYAYLFGKYSLLR